MISRSPGRGANTTIRHPHGYGREGTRKFGKKKTVIVDSRQRENGSVPHPMSLFDWCYLVL